MRLYSDNVREKYKEQFKGNQRVKISKSVFCLGWTYSTSFQPKTLNVGLECSTSCSQEIVNGAEQEKKNPMNRFRHHSWQLNENLSFTAAAVKKASARMYKNGIENNTENIIMTFCNQWDSLTGFLYSVLVTLFQKNWQTKKWSIDEKSEPWTDFHFVGSSSVISRLPIRKG